MPFGGFYEKSLFSHLNNLTALVHAAMRANPVRQFRFMAVRAL
jgi:hypothetical protein